MKSKPILLVISSTYPRWKNDPEPAFVHELNRRLVDDYEMHVVSPHAMNAAFEECIDDIYIHRFRYAPSFMETLVHNGGILANLKQNKFKWLLLPLFFLSMQIKIFKLVLRIKPVCIHAHWIVPQGLCLAILSMFMKLPPILLTSHGGDLFSLKGGFFAKVKSWTLSKMSAMTIVSNIMLTHAMRLGFPREKITVIPMGVDFNSRFVPNSSIVRSKQELLFVGRLVEKKGVSLLINALAVAVKKNPSIHLTIAGYGPELPSLKQLVQILNIESNVEFLGAVKQADLVLLYQRCAIFVAPFIEAKSGDQEGFPVSIIEAVACETPLITSELPVLIDAFNEYATQLTCNVKNINEFGEKIIHVLEEPTDTTKTVIYLRNKFIDDLDWVAIANRYKLLLSKLHVKTGE